MFYKTDNGEYSYHSFSMIIDTNIDADKLLNVHNSTFIHEYIHFLQNIHLPYLIKHTKKSLHEIDLLFAYIRNNLSYPVPFLYNSIELEDIDKELKVTLGINCNYEYKLTKIKNIKPPEVAHRMNTAIESRVFRYILEFYTDNYDEDNDIYLTYDYVIGAIDLLEYLAYKIENKFFNTDLPDIPYKIMDHVFNYYNLADIPDEVKLLLVEYSLYNDNPVHHLLKLLNNIKDQKYFIEYEDKLMRIPKETLYDYDFLKEILSSIAWKTNLTGEDTIFTKSKRRFDQIKEIVKHLFNKNYFIYINQWIDIVISYSEKNFANQFIFSKLFMMSMDEFGDYINEIIINVGIPILMNNNLQCIGQLPKGIFGDIDEANNEFLLFYILERFIENLKNGKTTCPMSDWCIGNGGEANSTCINDPLKKMCEVFNIINTNIISTYIINTNCPFSYFIGKFNLLKIKFQS